MPTFSQWKKDGRTVNATSPEEEVRFQFDGWQRVEPEKKSEPKK